MSLLKTKTGQWRLITVFLGALLFGVLGFIPGMGLPGAIMLAAGDLFLMAVAGFAGYESVNQYAWSQGPEMWAAVIAVHLYSPLVIFLSYLVAFRVQCFTGSLRYAVFVFAVILFSALITLGMHGENPPVMFLVGLFAS